jgi:hypothetical protein
VVGYADLDAVMWTVLDMHVYVKGSYLGTNSDGSLQAPFKTVTAGYQAVLSGGVITTFGGNYHEAIIMNKQLLLTATNGVVNIGKPQ